jgi:hypothetical protein
MPHYINNLKLIEIMELHKYLLISKTLGNIYILKNTHNFIFMPLQNEAVSDIIR